MSQTARDALLDEFERALEAFGRFVERLPPTALEHAAPGKDPTVRDVLAHVVDAAYRHVGYVAQHCGGRGAARRYRLEDVRDLETTLRGLHDAVRHAREALAPVDDAALRGARFPGRGGGNYDGEQMLEHAIVHPYRHRRQLRRLLGSDTE